MINTGSHVADYRPAEPILPLGPVSENWECWCMWLERFELVDSVLENILWLKSPHVDPEFKQI